MWVFLNNAFLSIVHTKDCQPDELLVRARFKGDIEAVFPDAKVTLSPSRDYRFRAIVPREAVIWQMKAQINNLFYPNFKGSVRENWRHDAYLRVWTVMEAEQRRRANLRGPQQPRFDLDVPINNQRHGIPQRREPLPEADDHVGKKRGQRNVRNR